MIMQWAKDSLAKIENEVEVLKSCLTQLEEESKTDHEVIDDLRKENKAFKAENEGLTAIIRDLSLTIKGMKNGSDN